MADKEPDCKCFGRRLCRWDDEKKTMVPGCEHNGANCPDATCMECSMMTLQYVLQNKDRGVAISSPDSLKTKAKGTDTWIERATPRYCGGG